MADIEGFTVIGGRDKLPTSTMTMEKPYQSKFNPLNVGESIDSRRSNDSGNNFGNFRGSNSGLGAAGLSILNNNKQTMNPDSFRMNESLPAVEKKQP
jgi:hypothetical protein